MAERDSQLSFGPMPLEKLQAPTRKHSIRAWVELIETAMRRAGLTRKHAALIAGISEQQLSNQLRYDGIEFRENLSLWRIHRWPPEFWAELIGLVVEYHDLQREAEHLSRAEVQAFRAFLKGQQL